jgi:glutathione synthase/RimK-type ligase-like ATP-grasp enzyme
MNELQVAIHRDSRSDTPFASGWANCLKQNGVAVKWVNLRLPDALDQMQGCRGLMWHWEYLPHERQMARTILRTIEHYLGIPVFPDQRTCWHYDDKIAQWYIFKAVGAPSPKTWIFWDPEPAREWACSAAYPVVFKLKTGSSSGNVHLVQTAHEALRLIDLMFGPGTYPRGFRPVGEDLNLPGLSKRRFGEVVGQWKRLVRSTIRGEVLETRYWWELEKGYAYFQEFVPGNDGDTRVTVIGDRAFGIYRFNRPGDFRASGSKLLTTDRARIDLACVALAHRLSAELGVQSMAYDFLRSADGRPLLGEMSYIYLDQPIAACEGHWDRELNWVPGRLTPQAAQVQDFLARLGHEAPGR